MDLVRRWTSWRRGAFAPAAAGLLLLAAASAPALAQTNIDTFATVQGILSDPPGGNSTATTGGADIIGAQRGIVVDNLSGAGPTTVVVGSGALTLTVTNTAPDSRGEARLSWDGDAAPLTLNPSGLGGVNLTTGGASGFRVRINSSTVANAELEMTVHTNATSSSRLGRTLPVIGAAQNFFLPFAEFVQSGTSAANFGSVGAIELTVRTKDQGATTGTVAIDEIITALPVIAATKVDAQIVDNPPADGKVDPGERVRYTVTITNTGSQATSVDLNDTVDANTTLVTGSVSSTPVAHNDQYVWYGNVTLNADGTPFPTLLANDADGDGDTLTVTAFDAASVQGGTVSGVNAATGEFTYTPPAGFRGVDSFTYTINDGDAHPVVATAYVTLAGMVWFVDDDSPCGTAPCGNGTQTIPFKSLASVNSSLTDPDSPGDIIFVYDDNGTPYPGGLTLEDTQELVGQGVGLTLGGNTIVAAGGTPQITNAAGVGLTLAADNNVRGLDVQGTSGAGIFGATFGTLTTTAVNVTGTGGSALDLATGNLAATFGTLSSTGAGGQRGIQLVTVTGSMTVTTTSLTNPTTQGIRVASSPAVVLDFGNTTITDNAVGSGPTATGIDVATGNAVASFTFDSLSVTTDAGAGLLANASGTINIGGTTNTINATGGAAVDITSTSLGGGATFSTLTSSNSAGKGVNLDTVTGAFTANGGTISGATGIAFDINAGASNVTYTGSVSNTANAFLIEVTSRTGGTVSFSGNLSSTSSGNGINIANNSVSGTPTINFSGATKTFNTGADPAVTLDNNDVATINFTGGGLDIDTTSGTGFNAINGAVGISVQGSNNSIFANGTGTALNVANTTIAAANLTFHSIAAGNATSTPTNGIVLNATGSLGGLVVTGDGNTTLGGNDSGGIIQRTTSDAIRLTNTRNVSLTNVTIQNVGTSPADGAKAIEAVNLAGSSFFRYGTITGTGQGGGADRNGIDIRNTDTNMTLFSVENGEFSNADSGTSYIFAMALGTSSMRVDVLNSVFFDMVPLAVQTAAGNTEGAVHTMTTNITGNTFRNASAADGQGGVAVVNTEQGCTHNFTISNNVFYDLIKGIAGGNSEILLAQTTGGELNGTISGNTLGNAIAGNGDRRAIGVIAEPDVSSNGELGGFDIIIEGNFVDRLPNREAIFVDVREDTEDSELIVRNNQIGQLTGFEGQVGGDAALAGAQREAIDIQNRGEVTRTLNLLLSGNNVRANTSANVVNLEVNIDNATPGNLTTHATVTGNTFKNDQAGGSPELIARPRDAGAVTTLCLDMSGNTLDGGAGQIDLNETGVLNVEQASQAALATANGIPSGNVLITGGAPTFGVVCSPPPT